jgi:hypothetical protein
MLVVFTKPRAKFAFIGHAIRFFTKNKDQEFKLVPSHMRFVFGSRFSLESTGISGVHIGFFPNTLNKDEVIAVFEYTKGKLLGYKDNELLVEGAFKYHGKKYDSSSILWFMWHLILKRLFGIPMPKKNRNDNKNRYFCSELMEFLYDSDYSHIDPNSLLDSLSINNDFLLLYHTNDNIKFNDWFKPELDKLKNFTR